MDLDILASLELLSLVDLCFIQRELITIQKQARRLADKSIIVALDEKSPFIVPTAKKCKAQMPSLETSKHKKIRRLRLTVCVRGGLPREPANETENVFEREKAGKRNVANRPPARFVRRDFAEQLCFCLKILLES